MPSLLAAALFRRPLLPAADRDGGAPAAAVPPGIADGRARFREIWRAVRDDHGHALPEDRPCDEALPPGPGEGAPTGRPVALGRARGGLRVVVVPGYLGECLAHVAPPFADALAHLATHGWRTATLTVSGRSSSARNARQIRDAVATMSLAPGERLLLVGHSKGAVDVLEALVAHPEIVPRVAAVVSVAGAVRGSPLADGLRPLAAALLARVPMARCGRGDGGALASLHRATRARFLATAALPPAVRWFSVAGVVRRADVSRLLRAGWERLAEIDPRNDGQVLAGDALIPGATLLGWVRADHWAIALPFSRRAPWLAATLVDRNAFPREVLLESIVRFVEESL